VGLVLLTKRGGKVRMTGLFQFLKKALNAFHFGLQRGFMGVEQRSYEVGRDGFDWLALLEEFFKIGLGGFPKSMHQRGRRRVSKFGV